MKILMSALACEPGKGSELEVGFRAMLAAASQHDVWVLTNKDTVPAVLRAIESRPEAGRIHLHGIDFGVDADGIALLTVPGFHFYYDRWQRRAASEAVELDRRVNFDVVHHATLAAYWTRTGVAVLDKPLVWGPIGGGVEPPLSLLGELGFRGFLEDAGRVVIRRFLGRFGPARRAQRRAVVTFAQNSATLERIHTIGRSSVMTNATVINLTDRHFTGTRTADVLFVGRLVFWKGPMLALRAFRYIRNPGARLVLCGEGPEKPRMQRAARRWGLSDRVHFEGFLPRDMLLSRVATAGALVHPALHEEAGLCVAEALALGTPTVCLDHGGPPEILRQWPDTPSAAIAPGDAETTARLLAQALDRFLTHPPPVCLNPRAAATSFDREVLSAYEIAAQVRRGTVWAFPRGKPQLFADSPQDLSSGLPVYGFGRRVPLAVHAGVALQVRLPGLRWLVAERCSRIEPVCGWSVWDGIAEAVCQRNPQASGRFLQFRSLRAKLRSGFVGLNRSRTPEFFLTVEPFATGPCSPLSPVPSFRVPACTDRFNFENWTVSQYELLPHYHRPARWNLQRIRQVAADASVALTGLLERPPDVPSHWRPIHGDLVPWNLREDRSRQLWLLDWEDAGWGPPSADIARYIVAYHSLGRTSPSRTAALVRTALATESADALSEVARFWLQHRNFRPAQRLPNSTPQMARDAARGARETATFQILARGSVEGGGEALMAAASANEPPI